MLQIRVTSSFNNPNLPVSAIGSKLYRTSALGIWELLDRTDKSGRGNELILSGLGFDYTGLVCDGVANHYVDTGVVEPNEYTIITSFQADIPAQTSQVWSCLPEGVTPYTGARSAILTSGALVATIASADISSVTNLLSPVFAPAWEIYAYTIKDDQLRTIRGSDSSVNSVTITGRKKSTKNIRIGGGYIFPHNIGIKGHIGTFALYNGVLDDGDILSLISSTRLIMAGRGVTIK